MHTYKASASAIGAATTKPGAVVTASASATASSSVSYKKALKKATNLAQNFANEIAQNDANLINQSTTISTELIDYNTKQINSAPDLIFYYSVDKEYYFTQTVLTGKNGAESILETYDITLFLDKELTQPTGTTVGTYIVHNTQINKPLYKRSGTQTFYLPKGEITRHSTIQAVKTSQGDYLLPVGTSTTPITCGIGDYLNIAGIVVITVYSDSSTRLVEIYFN